MKLYTFLPATGYEIIDAEESEGWDVLLTLDGSPRDQTWRPPRVRRVRRSKREGCRPSDGLYAGLSSILVFRRSSVDALRDILDAHGELLPLEDEDGVELYAYNPRALEAIDYSQSSGLRNDEGQLEVVSRHVFSLPVVQGVDAFRQVESKSGSIYLSERFLQRWKKAKLKGLDFILAWDSGLPPDQQPNVWKSKPVKMSTIR